MKILVLEDDELLLETIEDFLQDEFELTCHKNPYEAFDTCYKHKFDLYLLDIKLPNMSGIEFLEQLRESGDKTPCIFITSYKDKQILSNAFGVGADDYIKKPFDLNELKLRIQAVLSRSKNYIKKLEINENFYIDMDRKILIKNEQELNLNKKDIELLILLVLNKGKIVTKDMIQATLWNPSDNINDAAVRVYINNLKKIFGKNSISNIRGIGYRFEI